MVISLILILLKSPSSISFNDNIFKIVFFSLYFLLLFIGYSISTYF